MWLSGRLPTKSEEKATLVLTSRLRRQISAIESEL